MREQKQSCVLHVKFTLLKGRLTDTFQGRSPCTSVSVVLLGGELSRITLGLLTPVWICDIWGQEWSTLVHLLDQSLNLARNLNALKAMHDLDWRHSYCYCCCGGCVHMYCYFNLKSWCYENMNSLAIKPLDLSYLELFCIFSPKRIIFLVMACIIQSIAHPCCLAGRVLNCICTLHPTFAFVSCASNNVLLSTANWILNNLN